MPSDFGSIWELFPREAIISRAEQHIRTGLKSAFEALIGSLEQTVQDAGR